MVGARGDALDWALALARAPGERLVLRQRPLPEGMDGLLHIAAGHSGEVLADAVARTGESEADLVEAVRFYLREVLFHSGADAYRILGLERSASAAQAKSHHRWLQQWLHPDRHTSDWDAIFAGRVNAAWNQLRTDERRRAYDADHPAERLVPAVPAAPAMASWARDSLPEQSLWQRWQRRVPLLVLLVACAGLGLLALRDLARDEVLVAAAQERAGEGDAGDPLRRGDATLDAFGNLHIPARIAAPVTKAPPVSARVSRPPPVVRKSVAQHGDDSRTPSSVRVQSPAPVRPVPVQAPRVHKPAPVTSAPVRRTPARVAAASPVAAPPLTAAPKVAATAQVRAPPRTAAPKVGAIAQVPAPRRTAAPKVAVTPPAAPPPRAAAPKVAAASPVSALPRIRAIPPAAPRTSLPPPAAAIADAASPPAITRSVAPINPPAPQPAPKPVAAQPALKPVAPALAVAVTPPVVTAERVRQAQQVGARLIGFMRGPGASVPPIWDSLSAQKGATQLRESLLADASAGFSQADWRVGERDAQMQVAIRYADGRTGRLNAGLVWREQRWLVSRLNMERDW